MENAEGKRKRKNRKKSKRNQKNFKDFERGSRGLLADDDDADAGDVLAQRRGAMSEVKVTCL